MNEPVGKALQELLTSVGTRLSPEKVDDVTDWIDHHEWSLAVDILADALDVEEVELTSPERRALRAIIESIDEPLENYSYLKLDQVE